jgi:hypothetical protein
MHRVAGSENAAGIDLDIADSPVPLSVPPAFTVRPLELRIKPSTCSVPPLTMVAPV